jgi:hypothetical protein
VTGILRFVGVANAGVWLGSSVFYTVAVAPAMGSADMETVLGPKNFPFFSGAIAQLLLTRYFHLHLACASVALLHLLLEWLYLGRAVRRVWVYLLVALFWISLVGSFWLGPTLRELHRGQHLLNATPVQGVFQSLNVFLIAGVAVYFWRAVHPPDELRFVGSPKIRG